MTHITSKEYKEAAGTEKESTVVSMALPCWMNVVCNWEKAAEWRTPVAQMGTSRSRILSSSTWVTVHNNHGSRGPLDSRSLSEIIAALFKNLRDQ